jgi:hypothetical protein
MRSLQQDDAPYMDIRKSLILHRSREQDRTLRLPENTYWPQARGYNEML